MKKLIAILIGIGLSFSIVAFADDTNQSTDQKSDKETHHCCDCAKHKHKHS